MTFEIKLILLIKPFYYTTKKSRQRFKYHENEKSFWGEIFIIFKGLQLPKIWSESAPLILTFEIVILHLPEFSIAFSRKRGLVMSFIFIFIFIHYAILPFRCCQALWTKCLRKWMWMKIVMLLVHLVGCWPMILRTCLTRRGEGRSGY